MLTLQNVIDSIKEPDQAAADLARQRWDSGAKPVKSLGALERDLVRIAGVQGTPRITIGNKAIVVMCADNGIVEEGVTQTGQEVTAIVAEHMGDGTSCVCRMAAVAGAGGCSRHPADEGSPRNPQFPEGTGHEPPGSGTGPGDGDRRGGGNEPPGVYASGIR